MTVGSLPKFQVTSSEPNFKVENTMQKLYICSLPSVFFFSFSTFFDTWVCMYFSKPFTPFSFRSLWYLMHFWSHLALRQVLHSCSWNLQGPAVHTLIMKEPLGHSRNSIQCFGMAKKRNLDQNCQTDNHYITLANICGQHLGQYLWPILLSLGH